MDAPRRSTRSLFLSSTGWSAVAQLGIKATTSAGAILMTLLLRPSQLGEAAAATSLGLIFCVLYDAGFTTAVVRQLGSRVWDESSTKRAALAWRRIAFLPIVVITLVATVVSPHLGGWSLAPGVLGYAIAASFASLGTGLLNGVHDFRAATYAVIAGRSLGCVALGLALTFHTYASPLLAVTLLSCGEAVTGLLAFGMFNRRTSVQLTPETGVSTGSALRTSLPFALSTFFTLVYNRADVYVVAVFAGTQVAGLYAPASQLQNALMVLPGIAGAAIIPVGARLLSENDGVGVRWMLRASMRLSLALTIPVTTILWFALPHALPALLGTAYAGVSAPARLLLLSLPVLAFEIPLISILTAAAPKLASIVYGLGLVVCVAAHAALDHHYGPSGAAVAALSREPVMLAATVAALGYHRRTLRASSAARPH